MKAILKDFCLLVTRLFLAFLHVFARTMSLQVSCLSAGRRRSPKDEARGEVSVLDQCSQCASNACNILKAKNQ